MFLRVDTSKRYGLEFGKIFMPVTIFDTSLKNHPIADIHYKTEWQIVEVGGMRLNVTALQNVEESIDQVIGWLEQKGADPAEIENLAPYFGVIWPAAIALCAYLAQPEIKKQLSGKKIIELGCGLALPSIICAKAGGLCVAVDNHPNVPGFLHKNVEQNEPVQVTFLTPGELSQFSYEEENKFDWIIASDVLYDRDLARIFTDMVCKLAAPKARFVLTDPGRAYIQEFVNSMAARGWNHELQAWKVPQTAKGLGISSDIFVLIFERAG